MGVAARAPRGGLIWGDPVLNVESSARGRGPVKGGQIRDYDSISLHVRRPFPRPLVRAAPTMTPNANDRFVRTKEICAAVAGREEDILRALNIPWNGGRSH